MALCKNPHQIALMREAGRLNAIALQAVKAAIAPGVTTLELDQVAEQAIRQGGGVPSFKGYMGFPGSICASVNQCVVHGIPGNRRLREGDIVSIDIGTILEGWQADMADTFAVGEISPEAQRLIDVTRGCFEEGLKVLREGARLGDYGAAVQRYAQSHGCGVVRALTGHGIGRNMHEEPSVPNFGREGTGLKLKHGMVLACEPMITAGTWQVETLGDGWAVVTMDGSLAAHYEHTVLVTEDEPQILTLP
nr:type I methionyl aminopeptidase [bacterium]